MCKRFRVIAFAVGALALCAVTSMRANAQVYSSCAQYGSYVSGSYTVYTDEWGASSGQCLYVYSATNWTSTSNFTGTGIKAYPDTMFPVGSVALSSLSAVNTSFSFTVPSSGADYDVAYDLWTNSDTDEVMIWEEWNGDGPLAASYGCSGYPSTACPFATNVSINGSTWNVFQGNDGHNVISFLRTSQRSSGSENLLDYMNWAAGQGKLGSQTFYEADFGVEITSTTGSQNFTLNSYSSSIQTGGSCTPTTITPYISVNNGSSWAEENSATVSSTSTEVDLGPQPTSGGSWSWSGPSGYKSTSRQINDIPLKTGSNVYTATYTNSSGCKSTETFTITVN
jgi:hypothetical protein